VNQFQEANTKGVSEIESRFAGLRPRILIGLFFFFIDNAGVVYADRSTAGPSRGTRAEALCFLRVTFFPSAFSLPYTLTAPGWTWAKAFEAGAIIVMAVRRGCVRSRAAMQAQSAFIARRVDDGAAHACDNAQVSSCIARR
jgi:hypothetical protein